MTAYYDTGVLVPPYVSETFSDSILSFAANRQEPISYGMLHHLELDTAFRLKRFRGELDDAQAKAVIANLDEDVRAGRLVFRPIDWVAAMEEARRIGATATQHFGCRPLDLLHVAIALQWGSSVFVTADDRQIKAARSIGLRTVDVRTLPPGQDQDGGGPAAKPGMVRERRARYGRRRTKE